MKVKDIIIGNTYLLSGDIQNGYYDGKLHISHEEVTRKVTRITETHVVCECGREFLINNNLKITDNSSFRRF